MGLGQTDLATAPKELHTNSRPGGDGPPRYHTPTRVR